MASTPESDADRLLRALMELEEAVSVDYGLAADPKPRTAAALQRARDLIREARARVDARTRLAS